MTVHIFEQSRCLVVQIAGEIDHHALEDTREKIDKAFSRSNARHMIFDFKDVGFMDSSGIGMIIGRYRMIEQKGGKVAAANINSDLKRIFEVSGLQKIIPCYSDIDEAVSMTI